LLTAINEDFRACNSPESYLARAILSKISTENGDQKVILAWASNLKYSAQHFSDKDLTFIEILSSGWVANHPNIARLVSEVEKGIKDDAKAVVFDLLRNLQFILSNLTELHLCCKNSQGKFHLEAKVVISPASIKKKNN
jgi:hypothetical protein